GTVTRQPFPGNIIPVLLISPAARNLFADPSIYPLPQTTANINNWNAAAIQRVNEDLGDLKMDYMLSSRDSLAGRLSDDTRTDTTANPVRAIPTQPTITMPKSLTLNWNHTFSPSILNEARAGVNRTRSPSRATDTRNI